MKIQKLLLIINTSTIGTLNNITFTIRTDCKITHTFVIMNIIFGTYTFRKTYTFRT